jgi:DNA-binding SARP family transcriptional activator
VRLITFGGLALWRDGAPYQEPSIQRRQLALLVFLGAHGPGGCSRERLIANFWPDRPPERARNSLDQALSAARRTFGPDAIHGSATTLALNPACLALDLHEFDRAVQAKAWRDAIAIYNGPYLHGLEIDRAPGFARWVEDERARCARSYADVLEQLAIEADAAGRPAESIAWWQRLVDADPLSARGTTGLMLAMAASGERAAAIDLARSYDTRVAEALGAAPDPAIGMLADSLRRGSMPYGVQQPPTSAPARWTRWRVVIMVGVALLLIAGIALTVILL